MKKLFLMLSVFALAACGDDQEDLTPTLPAATESQQQPAGPEPQRLLTVEVGENPMQSEDGGTKTDAATTTETLSGFSMNYEDNKYDFSKTGDTWSTEKWPTSVGHDEKIDFYAYNYGTYIRNGSAPYVSFTQEESAFSQKDLLVATHKQISYNDNAGKVSLLFDHACAAVQFYVYKEESTTYVVKSIVLWKVKNTGEYHYNSRSWSEVSGEAHYTLTDGDITPSSTPELLPCKWMFFIPQDKSAIDIKVTYTKGGGAETTKTLHLTSGTWEAGHQYTVNIKIGK